MLVHQATHSLRDTRLASMLDWSRPSWCRHEQRAGSCARETRQCVHAAGGSHAAVTVQAGLAACGRGKHAGWEHLVDEDLDPLGSCAVCARLADLEHLDSHLLAAVHHGFVDCAKAAWPQAVYEALVQHASTSRLIPHAFDSRAPTCRTLIITPLRQAPVFLTPQPGMLAAIQHVRQSCKPCMGPVWGIPAPSSHGEPSGLCITAILLSSISHLPCCCSCSCCCSPPMFMAGWASAPLCTCRQCCSRSLHAAKAVLPHMAAVYHHKQAVHGHKFWKARHKLKSLCEMHDLVRKAARLLDKRWH